MNGTTSVLKRDMKKSLNFCICLTAKVHLRNVYPVTSCPQRPGGGRLTKILNNTVHKHRHS